MSATGPRRIPAVDDDPAPLLLLVRAAVNLPGLRLGWEAPVDPNDPYIARLIVAGLLVPVDPD